MDNRFFLFRIDSRLVHGQVCTRWIPEMQVKRVVIVNDIYAQDKFLCDLHAMVVPKGCVCDTIDSETALQQWNENQFGPQNTIVIFQTIADAMRVIRLGIPIKDVQIATLAGTKNSVTIYKQVNVTPEDAKLLCEMHDMGIRAYCQMYAGEPEQDVMDLMNQKKFKDKLGL